MSQPSYALPKKSLLALSSISAYKSMLAVLLEWIIIASLFYVNAIYESIPLLVISIIIIGSRLHALGVFMHEATHYRLHPNRKVNDFMGNVFCAWPILTTLASYRKNHLAHHRHMNTSEDPDWFSKIDVQYFQFPMARKDIVIAYLKALTGVMFFTFYLKRTLDISNNQKADTGKNSHKWIRFACYILILAGSYFSGYFSLIILLWLIPIMTSLVFFAHIRSVAEHFALPLEHKLNSTRTVKASWWEKVFCAPYNVQYHLEHHLYPSIPWYNLADCHQELCLNSDYLEHAHITGGYFSGLMAECQQSNDG